MDNCVLCLEDVTLFHSYIGLFSEEGFRLKIREIIKKHFWIQLDNPLRDEAKICCDCWAAVKDFNDFYQRISTAHSKFKSDPLPQTSTVDLVDSLRENFFDSGEIKVEVNELDLLPQIEVLEDPVGTNSHTFKCDADTNVDNSTKTLGNRFKNEQTNPSESADSNSDINLELADYLSVDLGNGTNDIDMQLPRRGLPRKVKEQWGKANDSTIKTEDEENMTDLEDDALEAFAATDDSDNSSTEADDSDSVVSLPDTNNGREKYAVIPKRTVVKPKKYRKREKPLIPPVRMSREEIDKRKAQQDEYDNIIAKFFNKFPCSKCDLLVKNFGDMRRHFRLTHNIDSGYMMCCGRKFHLRKTLAEHVLVHWNPNHFKCGTCERLFQDSRSLEVHEKQHINPPVLKEKRTFQCEKCPKSFTTKAALEYHSLAKHVPKSEFKFSCPECSKKLPTERKLKYHMKYTHDPESALICDKCGKQMRTRANLKKHHQLEHSDKPRPIPDPVQCEICGTWLRHLSGLKQHMKTIHEEAGGEHRCPICNKTSTNARALKRHIYHNHECERKFKCTMCEKAFKRPQDIREHTSTHTGEVLYTCPNCPMTFFSNANMYKHRQRLHRAEWEADRKKPQPPNIMRQAVGATASMKMRQKTGLNSFFPTDRSATPDTHNSIDIQQKSKQ